MASIYVSNYDDDEERWHRNRRGVRLPGQLRLPGYTQPRADSNTDDKYCKSCQYAGNFILTRPLINRIPDDHTYDTADMKHDTISLGRLADLQANESCICCQSIFSALEGRVVSQGRVLTRGQLYDWKAELCWNGDVFHCILYCRKHNETVALKLRASNLPSEPEVFNSRFFSYDKYARLMDVYNIDTTIIQEWIKTCDCLHGPESQKTASSLPATKLSWLYLIDLEKQCLVKVNTAQRPRYIALSYVWGGVEMLKTTSENLDKMLQPGALIDSQGIKGPKLARTIVDAMDLARNFDCPFFWTDCICIVQGPDQEEINERTMFLNEMASIYANAYLTIVAAEGADGNYGIPGIGRRSEPRNTLWREMRFPGHTLSLGPSGDVRPALYGKGKTWSTRGWTFQESYLSRRLLVFTSIVSFHCQKRTSCEWDFTPHDISRRWADIFADHFVDRTSFICNVPNWPNIRHYIDVVREYSRKSLSFDNDILHAFAGVTTVLNQSFHSGFHYGLPEVFFDVSLLWEPDWRNSTPPQLRKTEKLLLPSWSWVRTKGSIQTNVWQVFAEDFYKDTSYKGIYELKPRVQWWKVSSQGGASKPIKYQHFSNHASMPPGWDPPTFISGIYRRHDIKYSPTLPPGTIYSHPFPFPEGTEVHLSDVEYGPILRCIANRGWLIKSKERENSDLKDIYGTFNLCLSDGTWAGILFDDRLDQSFTQKSGKRCEVIAIAEGRDPGRFSDRVFPERRKLQDIISYEFYFILWIGWVDGIAYRRGIGRVLKRVWEKMELEEVEILLG